MDKVKLKQLIKRGEGPKVDFKLKLSLSTEGEKKEFAKDVIAIANSRGGRGYLIFGIEDKTKKIVGIQRDLYNEEKIQQVVYHRCDPPVPISIEYVDYNGKNVGVITIYKSNHKPHQMIYNGAYYLRRGSTTDTARRSELADMLQQNGFLTFETVILRNSILNDLDFGLIQNYFKNLNVYSENPSELLLEAMGIIGKETEKSGFVPTIGGMLIFGENPSLYLPHCNVRVLNKINLYKQGQNKTNLGEDKYFYGNIITILNNVSLYLEKILERSKYPFDLIIELVANAIVHRDYMDYSRGILVEMTNETIIISNPGSLSSTNCFYRFLREIGGKRRNLWLYQRLLIQDDKKRFLGNKMSLSKINNKNKNYKDLKFIDIGSQNMFKAILKL